MTSLNKIRRVWIDRCTRFIYRMPVLKLLSGISKGRLIIVDGAEKLDFGNEGLSVSMQIHDSRVYSHLILGGTIGAAEAFMKGYWTTDNLTGLIQIFLRNRRELGDLSTNFSILKRPFYKIFHKMRRDTPSQSKENISAHYDLGNDFFRLFLDSTLTYSSGYFCDFNDSMEKASVQKLDRICKKLELDPGDQILEIGTGWGSFAIHAATHYGCRVTTTTISDEQYEHVVNLVKDKKLEKQISVLKKDYRSLDGQFSKIVSIEMIEAVGLEYISTFFSVCNKLLKPGGLMLMQAITISEERFESAKNSVDFIQRYIFPGGALPSVDLLEQAGGREHLKSFGLEDITAHYAETMHRWHLEFKKNRGEMKNLGCQDSFLRMWEYYLCYCEGGFLEKAIGCVHMQFQKTGGRGKSA